MACCLTAPSYYLIQLRLIINEVLWHSSEGNFTGNAPKYSSMMWMLKSLIWYYSCVFQRVNTLRPRRNEQHFADDIFKRIFFNENVWIAINISLKYVPKGLINNMPALVQIMAWRRSVDKPLSEPMMVSLPTHICVTRPQWVRNLASNVRYHCIGFTWKYSLDDYSWNARALAYNYIG